MNTLTRTGIACALALTTSALAGPADASKTQSRLTSLDGSRTFEAHSAKGSYLALHFLPAAAGEAKAHADVVRDFDERLSSLAGLQTVFVTATNGTWTSSLGDASRLVFLDSGNALATELGLGATLAAPTTIVFDTDGRELFRHAGKSEHDHVSFADFEARFVKASTAASITQYNLPKGSRVAIEGYDPVAYFSIGKPTKGQDSIASVWRGVEYRFATSASRDTFNADPDKYCPTYGGWCATAMGAKGTKVEIDPENFKIKNGRLHLFYSDFFTDARKIWDKHEVEYEPKADENWKKATGESPRTDT